MNEHDRPRGTHRWAKGVAHSGQWKKGQAGGGAGLYGTPDLQRKLQGRKGRQALGALFRSRSTVAMHVLRRMMLDPATPPAIKLEASRLFLEYGWGKPESPAAKPGKAEKEQPIVVVSPISRRRDET